jgi:oligopeptidase B
VDHFITGVDVFASFWSVYGREGGYKNIWLLPQNILSTSRTGPLSLQRDLACVPSKDGVFVISSSSGNVEYDTTVFRFSYSSPIRAPETCQIVVSSPLHSSMLAWGTTIQVVKQKEVPNCDPSRYKTSRTFARAPDGTSIPISLVYPTALPARAHAPMLLYGYGSYGHSIDMHFNASILSFCDRGMVYAVAHVRGGSEMGRSWYALVYCMYACVCIRTRR